MDKKEYINKLWSKKSPDEVVLVMYRLIDNTDSTQSAKDKTYSVMKGIVTYLDRGDALLSHHREYLSNVWDVAWNGQVDNSVKNEIKEWLLDGTD